MQEGSQNAVGAVLAGGAGSRLGGAKPLYELAGRPLIAHALAAVEAAALEPLVVAKRDTPLPPLECELVLEPDEPRHPLCGIVAALRAAGGSPVVAVACDMPLVAPGLIAALAAADDPLLVPVVDGRTQPLLARYEPSLLPELDAALARSEPLRRTVEGLTPRLLDEAELRRFGDPRLLVLNVNDQGDAARAGEELSRRAR
jgi:molybdopterin-guanine dinucleotide biosynthesis protein A